MTDTESIERSAANFFARFFGDTSLLDALEDGRSFRYEPKPDITTYELALCMYLLIVQAWNKPLRDEQKIYDQLPAEAQRHFVVKYEEFNG
jgi:hypothetical protein